MHPPMDFIQNNLYSEISLNISGTLKMDFDELFPEIGQEEQ